MEWTKCETCGSHTSIGSYLFQAKKKKFPVNPEERVCILCGKATVVLFPTYEHLINPNVYDDPVI